MFEVGDKVEWCGVEGEVVDLYWSSILEGNRITVKFNYSGRTYDSTFIADGRELKWHKEPSLKLISRPKKKVKVYRHYWMYNHDFDESQLSVYVGFETWEEFATESMILWRTEELFECDGPQGGE